MKISELLEEKCNCSCGKAICESCGKPHKMKKVKEDAKEKFEPHMMYDPKTGEGKHAKVEKDHLDMKAKGWGHDKPKAKDIKVKEGRLKKGLSRKAKHASKASGRRSTKHGLRDDVEETTSTSVAVSIGGPGGGNGFVGGGIGTIKRAPGSKKKKAVDKKA